MQVRPPFRTVDVHLTTACLAENIQAAALNGELQVLRARVAKVDWLEHQNNTIRDELDQLKKSHQRSLREETQSPTKNRPEARTPLASLSVNKAHNSVTPNKHGDYANFSSLGRDGLIVEHTKLEEKYRKLRGQFSDSVKANELLQKQLRENIQSREKWAQHAKILDVQSTARKRRIEKLKARLSVVSQDAGVDASFVSDTQSEAGDGNIQQEKQPERSALNRANSPALSPQDILGNTDRESPVLDGTCVTEGTDRAPSLPPLPKLRDEAIHINRSAEPSSDTPIIVAERSVRKRRRDESSAIQTPAATRIKREEGSDPIVTSEQRRFMAHESIDFDNAEDMVETPRKNRNNRATSQTAVRNRSLDRRDRTSSTREGSSDASDAYERTSAHVQERDQAAAAQWRVDVQRDEHMETMDHNGPIDRSSALDVYVAPGPKRVSRQPRSKAVTGSALRGGIASLVEDGTILKSHPDSSARNAIKSGKLASLLNNVVSPEREAISLPLNLNAKEAATSHILQLPPKRALRFESGEDGIANVVKAPSTPAVNISKRTPSAMRVNKTPQSSKAVPLRERPAWSLKRTDFKINPKHNDGHDFAYGAVVRGKARAELPGCTKEECCGKHFRPLALAQLPDTGHIAFTSLLESFLGDDAHKLGSMTKDEKEKLWVEAKIRELSNKYGKHRERYSGMHEPPGWSRMGFPSTQEEDEDRETAKRLESDEVELRLREALNGGKYIFRDEDP